MRERIRRLSAAAGRAFSRASEVAQKLSLVVVALVGAAFGGALFYFRPEQNMAGIAAAVFSAAGTIVALMLPAAELAGQSLTRVADYWLDRFIKPGRRRPDKDVALGDIETHRWKARTAQRGSSYVLYAFVLSAFALLTPHVELGPQTFHAEHVLLGLAGGFLLVGSALFFPFAWAVYRLDDLKDAENFIRNFTEPREPTPVQEKPALPAPAPPKAEKPPPQHRRKDKSQHERRRRR